MLADIGRGVCWAIDAVCFAEDRLHFVPDPWQQQFLTSRAQAVLLNCCRQSGKSTTTAIVALHTAIYDPGIVLCVSPSLRQSKELFAKVMAFLKSIEPVIPLEEDNKSSCELSNGSRIVSLPGDPRTASGSPGRVTIRLPLESSHLDLLSSSKGITGSMLFKKSITLANNSRDCLSDGDTHRVNPGS